jgi:hypothetical protein
VDFLADDGGGHDEKDYGNQACEKPDALRTSGSPEGATGFAGSHTVQVMFNSWAIAWSAGMLRKSHEVYLYLDFSCRA